MFNPFRAKASREATAAELAAKLAQARSLAQQGLLAEAGTLCRELLIVQADHVDALLLSAEIAARSGDLAGAIPLYTRVTRLRPDDGLVHFFLGNVLFGCGERESALASYDRAAGLVPGHADVFSNRGVVLEQLHRRDEALASYEQAIAANPRHAQAHFHRANLLKASQRGDEALASYDRAIASDPRFAAAYGYRGVLLYERQELDAALASYDRAIELDPKYAEAYYNRGVLLQARKRPDAAMVDYGKALAIVPHYAEAHMNRGALLYANKQFDEALIEFDAAIALNPDYTQAFYNRALLYVEIRLLEAALADLDRAIALDRDFVAAHYKRAWTLFEMKRFAEALAGFDRVLGLEPHSRSVLGMRVLVAMTLCDWRDFESHTRRLADGVRAGLDLSAPLPVLAFFDEPALHLQAARIWARGECAVEDLLPPIGQRAAADKIRIGYFSADFREHIVALVMAEVFETHDRSKFEITAFAFGPDTQDELRLRLRRTFDRFIDVSAMADREVALLARSLGIDIAVDLGGYTGGCRTKIFALRAAPIQVNYLGYPGTLGAEYMDYLIADRTVIPEAGQCHYTEKIIYLPHSYLPSGSTRTIADTPFTREQFGLPPTAFVFCCFNSLYKITPGTFDAWMRILARVPGSVLWFSQGSVTAAANLKQAATDRGIAADRLIFADHMPSLADHLARHALGDLFLDTLPYNAHATALDALWAGLPVLTRIGEAFAGRVAASLLHTLELPELIAATPEQYENLAVELATHPQRLAAIRNKLAKNRLATPLFDKRAFTRHLESAYAAVLARHRAGLAPEHTTVAEAMPQYREVLAREPEQADAIAHYERGNLLKDGGRYEEALASYDRAIALDPDYAYAFCNRGVVLERLDRWDAACESYDRAVALAPDDPLAHYNRGTVLRVLGRFEEALASYARAIALAPGYADCHCNQGILLTELKRWDAALASLDRAIALKPGFAAAHLHRGKLFAELQQDERAVADFERAVALDPECGDAYEQRAYALLRLRRYEEAIASGERALELQPEGAFLPGLSLNAMQICDWREREAAVQRLVEGIEAGRKMTAPFAVLPLVDSPALHHKAAQIWVRALFPADRSLPPIAGRPSGDRLRIGYFSADLYDHVVGVVAAQIFEMHDRARFEITAFSFGPDTQDPVRKRLEQAFDRFIDVRGRSDREVALLARELRIDIAVDLGGHSQTASNKIFALRAAPVQVNYLGYPGTSGASYMDYLIADRTIVPPAHFAHYEEKVVHLPHSYLPYDSTRVIGEVLPQRERLGLPPTGFVFCCFNAAYKIAPATFAGWMRILSRVDGSVLWLARSHPTAAANLRREAACRGIDPDRLVFADRVDSAPEHLARFRAADLFLDTLPYNAHATAMDALWTGLPVVTRIGGAFPGRVAASLLRTMELPELVTTSPQQYEDLAVALAVDPERLQELREKLAHKRSSSPLFDTPLFARHLEAAYMAMQARHQDGLPPDHIDLAS
jgi:predicted O-linked N-acetylglucosamine transferase (SPINDLY family)